MSRWLTGRADMRGLHVRGLLSRRSCRPPPAWLIVEMRRHRVRPIRSVRAALFPELPTVNVTLITCWFANSYGLYSDALRQALERRLGTEVAVVASNCGCNDPSEIKRDFQDERRDFFVMPNMLYWKGKHPLAYRVRNVLRQVLYRARAKRYLAHARGAEVMHFQQTLNATGCATVYNWLRLPSDAARVVTVHELDPHQVDIPEVNKAYNLADRVIVHTEEMKTDLVNLSVQADLIDVIPQGVNIGPLPDETRSGLLYYGGHRLTGTKGFETLLEAMSIVKTRMGAQTPRLTIYGYYGLTAPDFAVRLVAEHGLTDNVRWRDWLPLAEAVEEYARAELLLVPSRTVSRSSGPGRQACRSTWGRSASGSRRTMPRGLPLRSSAS
jgi:glycosyltransferase involved in cell wall biosynthesis